MNRLTLSTLSLTTAIVVMTLGYATPAFAAKPDCDSDSDSSHPSCKTDGDAAFTVDIGQLELGELLQGGSGDDLWVQGFGGKNAIGLNDASGLDVGTLTGVGSLGLDILSPLCFPADFMPPPDPGEESVHTSFSDLHQALIKPGKQGRAEASFWFHGFTNDGYMVRVLYVLKLFGKFESNKEWPGAQTLEMTSWELKVENEGKTIKDKSCSGKGDGKVDITIT